MTAPTLLARVGHGVAIAGGVLFLPLLVLFLREGTDIKTFADFDAKGRTELICAAAGVALVVVGGTLRWLGGRPTAVAPTRDLADDDLGPPLAVFYTTRWLLVGMAVAYLFALGCGVLVGFAVWSLQQPGPRKPDEVQGMWIGVGAGIGGMILGGVFAFLGHRARTWRAVVCADGFFLRRPGALESFRWDDITSLYRGVTQLRVVGVPLVTDCRSRVVMADGRHGETTAFFRNSVELGRMIDEEVTRRLLPPALARIDAGEAAPFGVLAATRDGLRKLAHHGPLPDALGDLLPWGEVERCEIERGWLVVKRRGDWLNWHSAMAGGVPNLAVLLAIADRYREAR